jgi:hypothetical protein
MSRSVATHSYVPTADEAFVARAMAARLKDIAASHADIEVHLVGRPDKPLRVPARTVDALEKLLDAVGNRRPSPSMPSPEIWARTPLP